MPQSSLFVILRTFLTQRALRGKLDTQKTLQENFKAIAKVLFSTGALKGCLGTWKLKVLGHYEVEALRHLKSTWALEHLRHWGTRRALGYSTLKALRHLDNQTLGHSNNRRELEHSDTQAHRQSGTQVLGHSRLLRHFIQQTVSWFIVNFYKILL